jgi:2-polyprenyl-6-methoxyphenol hydroxylase-like FAD-dependent oxidoreductase
MKVCHALIVGGGFAGMAAAIEMRKRGLAVDLVEIDPDWRSYGAGISLGAPTLRAFQRLGILDAFLECGSASDGVEIFTANGHKIATIPTPRLARPDVPGGGGVMRPALAAILAQATRKAGANINLGVKVETLTPRGDQVEVLLSDGSKGRYDLVVGADGLNSQMRQTVFPDAPAPAYVGQCVWRAVLPRPPEAQTVMMWMGRKVKAGINPVSRDQMYLFVTEDRLNNDRIAPEAFLPLLQKLLTPFTAPTMEFVRAQLNENSQIVYRPIEWLLAPRPWGRGRIVLIGDAAHATTPHLASGACIGVEDGIVLAEMLAEADTVEAALRAFEARRWERCRMVVENSVRLAEIEINDGDPSEHARLMGQSMGALAAPI